MDPNCVQVIDDDLLTEDGWYAEIYKYRTQASYVGFFKNKNPALGTAIAYSASFEDLSSYFKNCRKPKKSWIESWKV